MQPLKQSSVDPESLKPIFMESRRKVKDLSSGAFRRMFSKEMLKESGPQVLPLEDHYTVQRKYIDKDENYVEELMTTQIIDQ